MQLNQARTAHRSSSVCCNLGKGLVCDYVHTPPCALGGGGGGNQCFRSKLSTSSKWQWPGVNNEKQLLPVCEYLWAADLSRNTIFLCVGYKGSAPKGIFNPYRRMRTRETERETALFKQAKAGLGFNAIPERRLFLMQAAGLPIIYSQPQNEEQPI